MSLRLRIRRFRAKHYGPKSIREATVGKDALVRGCVEAVDDPDRSLFTGRPGVALDLELAVPWRDEDGKIRYRVIATRTTRRSFAIVDAAGDRIVLTAEHLRLEIPAEDVSMRIPHVFEPGSPVAAFLRQEGIVPVDFIGIQGYYAFLERCVAIGDAVEVLGRVGRGNVASPSVYRSASMSAKALIGDEAVPIVLRARE